MDKKKLAYWVVGGVVAIFIFGAMAGGGSSTDSKDNKKSTESAKVDKKQEQLDALNKWYKNDYKEENGDFSNKKNSFVEFEIAGNNLVASVYQVELEKNNISKKDIADYSLIYVLPFYEGDLSAFDNIDKGQLAGTKTQQADIYVNYYIK